MFGSIYHYDILYDFTWDVKVASSHYVWYGFSKVILRFLDSVLHQKHAMSLMSVLRAVHSTQRKLGILWYPWIKVKPLETAMRNYEEGIYRLVLQSLTAENSTHR